MNRPSSEQSSIHQQNQPQPSSSSSFSTLPPETNHHPHQNPNPVLSDQSPSSPHSPLQPHQLLLIDLIESEKAYANDLFIIIKRIAAAYSPQNFPPIHIDHHFRLIESIFRSHKLFVAKLLQLECPPDSFPLGPFAQLLVSWLKDLSPVYHRYCSPNGWAGAGRWSQDKGVMSNQLLVSTLLSLPWPSSLPPPPNEIFPGAPYHPDDQYMIDGHRQVHASLTVHFALPFSRLVYYRRLYEKALHQFQPAGPEHRMIFEASNRLSELLDLGCSQWSVDPLGRSLGASGDKGGGDTRTSHSDSSSPRPPTQPLRIQQNHKGNNHLRDNSASSNQPVPPTQSKSSVSILPQQLSGPPNSQAPNHPPQSSNGTVSLRRVDLSDVSPVEDRSSSVDPSVRASTATSVSNGFANSSISSLNDEVSDRTGPSTPLSAASSASEKPIFVSSPMVEISPGIQVQQAVLDLHHQLDTTRCKDIFTMTPKLCRLHLAPATLTHPRNIRVSTDASFKIRPQSNPASELQTPSGRLILLTDLLMFCERIPPDQRGTSSLSMWLMYPPLAAKHLWVNASSVDERELEVIVMGKEVVKVTLRSRADRDHCTQALAEAIKFAINPPQTQASVSRSGSLPLPSLLAHLPENPGPVFPPMPGTLSGVQNQFPDNPTPTSSTSNHTSKHPFSPSNDGPKSNPMSPSLKSVDNTSPSRHSGPGPSHLHLPTQDIGPLKVKPLTTAQEQKAPQPLSDNSERPRISHLSKTDHQPTGSVDETNFQSKIPLPIKVVIPTTAPPTRPGPLKTSHSSGESHASALRLKSSVPPTTSKIIPPLRKAPSAHALGGHRSSTDSRSDCAPPLPRSGAQAVNPQFLQNNSGDPSSVPSRSYSGMLTPSGPETISRSSSAEPAIKELQFRPPSSVLMLNQNRVAQRDYNGQKMNQPGSTQREDDEESLHESPKEEKVTQSVLAATMKTKVFLKQAHSQWKSLGSANLHVFIQNPGNLKQLVVGDSKGKTIISTMVITDAVERVGRTGVAVDLSDKGVRTGIVYMLQMKSETSADGLFEQLLAGSDRRPKP